MVLLFSLLGIMSQVEANEVISDYGRGLRVGSEVILAPLVVGDRSFHFNDDQTRFLYHLQKFGGDLEKSCSACMQTMEWANKFIKSRKFREFRNALLALKSARSGELVDWWWDFGKRGASGINAYYTSECGHCTQKNVYSTTELEMTRDDDMVLHPLCKVCMQPVEAELHEDQFKPTREQVQFWQELGNRLAPKVERVQHTFTDERFVFETDS